MAIGWIFVGTTFGFLAAVASALTSGVSVLGFIGIYTGVGTATSLALILSHAILCPLVSNYLGRFLPATPDAPLVPKRKCATYLPG
ncbi:MAG: hypothetical protein AAFX00_02420 [Pseudomonadota bacterium]